MSQIINLNSQNSYEIKVCGQLDNSWLEWLGEVEIQVEYLDEVGLVTMISNILMDQAGLVGLVRRLHGLGILLISIHLGIPP